ncbi:MAG: aspartate aminotransferase family protein [Candidatus Rokubacteria bacterium]|nr:aspartate aminotransferase family protein [Candidatus Rokubacteria bacterium]
MESSLLTRDLRRSYPVVDRGEGMYLYDRDGRRYIDAVGGAMVVTIGHGVKEVVTAVAAQMERVAYAYTGQFVTEALLLLAERVISMAPAGMSKVYFVSGGSEANEIAIKLARQYFVAQGQESKWRVIARWQSYHGTTGIALSATGRRPARRGYEPYLLAFPHIPPCYCYRCPFDKAYPDCRVACAEELERVIRLEGPETIAAFIAEPIVGTSAAALTPPPEYFQRIRAICDRYNILFIADEVVTGFGRTGTNFAIEQFGVTPDMITMAKGVSSGYAPLGGVIIHERIVQGFLKSGASPVLPLTYAGNPMAAAAGLAVLDYITANRLLERVREIGPYFFDRLRTLETLPWVGEVRGRGLMAGVELVQDRPSKATFPEQWRVAPRVVEEAMRRGLIILPGQPGMVDGVAGDHLMLTPPYIVKEGEIDEIVAILRAAIETVVTELEAAKRAG